MTKPMNLYIEISSQISNKLYVILAYQIHSEIEHTLSDRLDRDIYGLLYEKTYHNLFPRFWHQYKKDTIDLKVWYNKLDLKEGDNGTKI